jgi:hypothetical protein
MWPHQIAIYEVVAAALQGHHSSRREADAPMIFVPDDAAALWTRSGVRIDLP